MKLVATRKATAEADPLSVFVAESADGTVPAPPPRPKSPAWFIPAAIVVVTLAAAAGGGWSLWRRWSAPPALGAVTISSTPAGAEVLVGGVSRGHAPLTFSVVPGAQTIVVVSGTQRIPVDLTVASGASIAQHVVFASGEAALSPRLPDVPVPPAPVPDKAVEPQGLAAGYVSIASSIPLRIVENGQVIGSSEVSRLMLPAGTHDVELINDDLGFRERRRMNVASGKSTLLNVDAPKVPLNINAAPWAEVSVDGRAAGETPIGNYPVTIGSHLVTFRHPEFGERQQRITVGLKTPARVTIDMKKDQK